MRLESLTELQFEIAADSKVPPSSPQSKAPVTNFDN